MQTFWTSAGWRSATKITAGLPSDAAHEAAVAAGVMFEPPTWSVGHDELVEIVRSASSEIAVDDVAESFISSLTTRRLDLRSALGSFAVGRLLPSHSAEPGPSYGCAICGMPTSGQEINLNTLNFERFKWGGVRRDDIPYVAFDLTQYMRAPRDPPLPEHVALGQELIAQLRTFEPNVTATEAARRLRVLKGNVQEREVVVDILGVCGILETPVHRGDGERFVPYRERRIPPRKYVERVYPVCWWRSADGISTRNLRRFLPQLG